MRLLPLRIRSGAVSCIIRSDWAMAHVSSLSSWPKTLTIAAGLRSLMWCRAVMSIPPVPAAGS